RLFGLRLFGLRRRAFVLRNTLVGGLLALGLFVTLRFTGIGVALGLILGVSGFGIGLLPLAAVFGFRLLAGVGAIAFVLDLTFLLLILDRLRLLAASLVLTFLRRCLRFARSFFLALALCGILLGLGFFLLAVLDLLFDILGLFG